MKDFEAIKSTARTLFLMAGFVGHIHNNDEYHDALALMDELVEEYDLYLPLIEVLASSIEQWEDKADEFIEFNQRIELLDHGVATLRVLMDQYHLKAEDLKDIIGGKSLVSMILNGSRKLTKEHIQALSNKYHISPALFFA